MKKLITFVVAEDSSTALSLWILEEGTRAWKTKTLLVRCMIWSAENSIRGRTREKQEFMD